MYFFSPKFFTFRVILIFSTLLFTGCSLSNTASNSTDSLEDAVESAVPENTLLEEDSVYFGVLAIDSAMSVNERYRPLMQYLSTEIQRPVELVILSQEDQFTKVEEGILDFSTTNPLAAVQIQRLYETEFILTHVRPKTGAKFSGLIIVNSDSEISSIKDLMGKRAACVDFQTAAAGCIFQIYHLLQNGFDPYKDFDSFIENKSQDNIVLAVLNGAIDVGFIRTGQLEKMVENGSLSSLDDVRIIDAADSDFLYPHTTNLYPEWPVAALKNTDPKLIEEVRSALVKLTPDHPALVNLRVDGFVSAVDYTSLNQLIETLELKSWDASNSSR